MKRTPPRVTLDTPIISPKVDLDAEEVVTATGHQLSAGDVAELVEDAHRTTAGRPSLSAPGGHSPQVTLRLPTDLLARLDAEASRKGLRRSALVRRLLEENLAG